MKEENISEAFESIREYINRWAKLMDKLIRHYEVF